MPCSFCTDPDGAPCFPVYGLAPHTYTPVGFVVVTTFTPKVNWPANFTPDENDSEMGTYHCPVCGEGKPEPIAQGPAE